MPGLSLSLSHSYVSRNDDRSFIMTRVIVREAFSEVLSWSRL